MLQMMKEFKQEQDEGKTSDREDDEKNLNSAINGISRLDADGTDGASDTSNNGKVLYNKLFVGPQTSILSLF